MSRRTPTLPDFVSNP